MNIPLNPPNNTEEFAGNIIRPFQLESSSFRGRIVRFNTVLDSILTGHSYPDIVSELLGEMVTLSALLSSMLKFDGVFTLQTSGNGPISMLVVDMTTSGDVRGCASFDEERLSALKNPSFNDLIGEGYIAFTVDQGQNMERYQGIVELKESLLKSVEHYFTQSEQIKTDIKIAVGKEDGQWKSGGLMLQHMPAEGGHEGKEKEKTKKDLDEQEEDWSRASILMQSCKDEELLSDALNSHAILLRLFHEEGVRVFEPKPLQHQCRCSQDKVMNVYKMLSDEEREDMKQDGEVVLTCEFCSKKYKIDA